MTTTGPNEPDAHRALRACIGKIATGPEYSKDLSFDEAYTAMRYILEGKVDPVQSGVFLIALRMKRETDAENSGSLRAIMNVTKTAIAPVDEVVDIADPYDGYTRCLPVSPFLPTVLAACNVPAVSHGLETVAPKYGTTHRKVLRATGVNVDLDTKYAAARIGNPNIGWAYVDQKHFCPALNSLGKLRELIVKRPVISTVENLTGPIRGRKHTHLVTGYVHRGYPPIYARLARESGFASAVLVRGVEGGVVPSLRQSSRVYEYHDNGELKFRDVNPTSIGIEQSSRAVSLPEDLIVMSAEDDSDAAVDPDAAAKAAAEAGCAALDGASGAARDSLVYSGAIVLTHLHRFEAMQAAAEAVRHALDSGAARAHFYAR
jgi:anthranilate phosphoribosyltransferase